MDVVSVDAGAGAVGDVEPGQVDVENQQIVPAAQPLVHAIQPVAHQIDGIAGLGQTLPEIVAGLRFVFDDEDFHGRILPEPAATCPQITNL